MQQVLIAIPTYNEVDNLDFLLSTIFELYPTIHVLIIDDNSTDGSRDKVRQFQRKHPDQLFLLERPGKMGLGTAYLAAFSWALEKNLYESVIQMDADLSHNPAYVQTMLSTLDKGNDLVIGSRYIRGGGTENWNPLRKLISRFGSFYARMILGIPANDLTGGFNCWRTSLLSALDLGAIKSNGYCFQIEMKYRAFKRRANIQEIPIKFVERREGQSKMSGRIVLEAIYRVWLIKFS